MKSVMKKAWEIRRKSAERFNCRVSEIDFSSCLKMAWAEEKEGKMKISEAIERLEKNGVEILTWYGTAADTENGQEFELKNGYLLIESDRNGYLEVSGKGFKKDWVPSAKSVREWLPQIAALTGHKVREPRKQYRNREVESCDGGYQSCRY